MTDRPSPGQDDAAVPSCRFCGAPLHRMFVDLGVSPLCEHFLALDELGRMEPFYPLDVRICDACLLVQLPAYVPPDEIFTEYAYFSSYADSWVEHARRYADRMIDELRLDAASSVVEVASNDGYLLQHFVAAGIPAYGVEPARNVAAEAIRRGIPTIVEFFGEALADRLVAERGPADLVCANNVFAHIPDITDFARGLRRLLRAGGTATIEVAHLARLIEANQFDTIYHEHFTYYTVHSARRVLEAAGLRLLDVEDLSTHGGSIRLFLGRDDDQRPVSTRVDEALAREADARLDRLEGYEGFGDRVARTKHDLLTFLIDARRDGKRIVGYGAPGKGNTLLNYCGIRTDLLEYTVDRNPYKHGRFTPGTRIPIHPPDRIFETRPDLVLILPWNLRDEIVSQLEGIREWGGRFVVPIPAVEVV